MPRKYSGPLRPGEKSAKVPRGYTKKMSYVPRKAKSTKKLVKSVLLNMAETNYKSHDQKGQVFLHDVLARQDLWKVNTTAADSIWPAVGDGDANRTGDMIQATGIKIRGVFEIPNDRFNMRMKIWFVQWNTGDGVPNTQNDFQHNISGNIMLDPIQNKRFRSVKYLGMVRCRASDTQTASAQTKTIFFERWIPIKKKVYFKADGSELPTNMKEYGSLVFAPYDTISSSQTDIVVASSEITYTLYYKDI